MVFFFLTVYAFENSWRFFVQLYYIHFSFFSVRFVEDVAFDLDFEGMLRFS